MQLITVAKWSETVDFVGWFVAHTKKTIMENEMRGIYHILSIRDDFQCPVYIYGAYKIAWLDYRHGVLNNFCFKKCVPV